MEWSESPVAAASVRIVLLDDQALLRTSLARVLSSQPGFELVAECGHSDEALDVLISGAVDVVLLESDLENEHDFVSAALRSGYRGKFLVMSSSAEPKDSAHALKRGVSGVFLKTESVARLLQAVRAVAQGEIWIDPKVIQGLVERFPEDGSRGEHDFPPLSEREHRVLGGIIDGLSNKKIGDALTISEGSVKAVVQQLFEKAGVRTRSQLVRIAMERSLNAVGRQISGG